MYGSSRKSTGGGEGVRAMIDAAGTLPWMFTGFAM